MQTLKNFFLVSAFFFAKQGYSQLKFGVEGGYNAARFAPSGATPVGDNAISWSSVNAFAAGITSEIPLTRKMMLQPALLFFGNGTYLGDQSTLPGYYSSSRTTIRLYYLRLPVSVVDRIKLDNHLYFVAGAGVYAAKGISGRAKGSDEGMSAYSTPFAYTFDKKVDFSNGISLSPQSTTFIKPFDFGWQLQGGLEWTGVELTATYSRGFSSIYSENGYHYKNAAFAISLGYFFPLK